MNNTPPIREQVDMGWTPSWANWFQQVFECLRWTRSFSAATTLNFPAIPAQSQSSLSFSVQGARVGDAALLTPSVDVPGLIFSAAVTANNTISVTAKNFTTAAVDAPAISFRLIVLQT